MANMASFFDDSVYLFTGGVSHCWNDAWRQQRFPLETSGVSATTTPGQLLDSFAYGLERNSSVGVAAARFRRLDLLQIARDAGCPWHIDVAIELVRGGFIDEVKQACSGEDACPIDDKVMTAAVQGRHWRLMGWLCERGCTFSSEAMAAIAAHADPDGNYGICSLLQFARTRGGTWDADTSVNLASRGLMGALAWAVKEGCPMSTATANVAAGRGYAGIVKWLLKQGCPMDKWNVVKTVRAFEGALFTERIPDAGVDVASESSVWPCRPP